MKLAAAAGELGISVSTLRRWLAAGAPHVPGRRGRGQSAEIDPQAVRQWLAEGRPELNLQALGVRLPAAMGRAVFDAWRELDGPQKRRDAALVAGVWFACATATCDVLRADDPTIAEPRIPPEVAHLRKIANG